MKKTKYFGLILTLAVVAAGLGVPMQAQVPQSVPYANTLANRRVDLSQLEAALQAQDWEAADNETRRILQSFVHPGGDIFAQPIPTLIPPEVIQAMDRLWIKASNGRFGFSVQAEIWEELRLQTPDDTNIVTKAFGDRVDWTRTVPNEDYIFTSPDWLTEPELIYSLDASVGHLPWAGVDWSVIEGMLTAQSCGSCTIDVLYLQGDRFGRYLPSLYNWLETALDWPIPQAGTWQQAQLVRQINLRSLYPNSACPIRMASSAINPDSSLIAISSYSYERSCPSAGENTLALWDAQRGNRIITLHRGSALEALQDETGRVGEMANSVAFTPDGQFMAAGMSYGVVRLWSTDTWEQVQVFEGHPYAVRAIAISSDGKTLVSAGDDQTLKVWNLETGKPLRTIALDKSDGIVRSLIISPDGQRLGTVTNRKTIQLWNVQTGQLVRTLVNKAIGLQPEMAIAFSVDGQTLATTDTDHSVKLWNANNGARVITLKGHTELPRDLAFSPDGRFLASSDGATARIWALSNYAVAHTFELVDSVGHPTEIWNPAQIAFSPDGQTLAANTLLLPIVQSEPIPQVGITFWDITTGQSIEQIREVSQFQFSPDGRFLMAHGQQVQIWKPYSSLVAAPYPASLNRINPLSPGRTRPKSYQLLVVTGESDITT